MDLIKDYGLHLALVLLLVVSPVAQSIIQRHGVCACAQAWLLCVSVFDKAIKILRSLL